MNNNVLFILGAVIIIFQIITVLLIIISKKNADNSAIFDEFSRNRKELSDSLTSFRDETGSRLEKIEDKILRMADENHQSKLDLLEKTSAAFREIDRHNAEQNERQTNVVAESIKKLQEQNEKKLDEMRSTVDEKLTSTLNNRLTSSFKTVSDQLENVYRSLGEMKELSQGVTTNVSSLNRVLTNVKARGTWAEYQLKGILDQTIPGLYVQNYSPKNNSEHVEFAVRFPNGENKDEFVYLPIDSKFPMEDYVRVCEAADNGDIERLNAARKALEDRVIAEAKDIKKYIDVPKTTPFAILYLATEALYAEIASSKNGVAEKLQAQNIMIAGPTTITALLNSFAMGFKAMAINEKADEVRQLLAATKAQYETFETVLKKAKKKIDEAGQTLDDAQKRNNIIQKKLKTVDSLEQSKADMLLGTYDPEDENEQYQEENL